jgi:hypothetical protein
LREELADLCDVRVCLGGKLAGFSGKMPGIVEEALGALRKGRPVFTSGIFGGASRFIVDEMSQGKVTFTKQSPDPKLSEQAAEIRKLSATFSRGLEASEEERLWRCTSTEQCVELILRGTLKWFARHREKQG